MSSHDTFPPVSELSEQTNLPNPFLDANGTCISTIADWPQQRTYLKAMLQHYMYGHMPPRPKPEQITLEQTHTESAFDGLGIKEQITVTLTRNQQNVQFTIALFRPTEKKQYPTIVKNCRVLFDAKATPSPLSIPRRQQIIDNDLNAAQEALKRGYILCKFAREQLMLDDKNAKPNGVQWLYPEYDWGAIGIWAWGHSVVLDILDHLGYTNLTQTIATGHSRGGQTAIAAGIFDERIAMVVPCTGGYGSCGTLRIRDPKGVRGTEDYIAKNIVTSAPHWHISRYHEFVGQQNKLPFDAHTLIALIAPRPMLNTNATEDEYNNTLSIEAGIRAGQIVYDKLGAKHWCRLHWRPGKHAQKEEDWGALFDFADEYFFQKQGNSTFNQWLYPDITPSIHWDTPAPQNT